MKSPTVSYVLNFLETLPAHFTQAAYGGFNTHYSVQLLAALYTLDKFWTAGLASEVISEMLVGARSKTGVAAAGVTKLT
jgi:hypothetical protein